MSTDINHYDSLQWQFISDEMQYQADLNMAAKQAQTGSLSLESSYRVGIDNEACTQDLQALQDSPNSQDNLMANTAIEDMKETDSIGIFMSINDAGCNVYSIETVLNDEFGYENPEGAQNLQDCNQAFNMFNSQYPIY